MPSEVNGLPVLAFENQRVSNLVQLVACTMMFCLPWAGNVDLPGAKFVSLGFNIGSLGLILIWIFSVKNPAKSMPKSFLYFIFYILAHTVIFYGFFRSSSLMSSEIVNVGFENEEGISPIVFITRVTLFILTVYAISSICTNVRLIKNMALSLGASIVVILLLGGNYFTTATGVRFSGGYANPNSFASVVVLLCFLEIFVLSEPQFKRGTRVIAGSLLAVSIVVILMTASRSAMLSLLGGCGVLVLLGDVKKGILYSALLALAIISIVTLVAPTLFSFALSRFTNGMGSGRLFIWIAYLQSWQEYIEYGVGLGREMTVLKSLTYNGRIWPPHSTFLRILVAFGAVGFSFFVYSLWSMAQSVVRIQKTRQSDFKSRLLMAFLVSILIQMFFGDHFDNRAVWLSIGFIGAYRSILTQTS